MKIQSRAAPNSALVQQWQDASWIWLSDGTDLNVPSGDWAFRTTYTPPSGRAAVSANILITADDYFLLYINGQQIGGTRTPANNGQTVWATALGYSVTLNTNGATPVIFAVLATNGGSGTAAGLLVAIQITLADGSTATVSTGRSGWRATGNIPQNFEQPGTSDSGWATPVTIEKNAGNAPWGVVQLPGDLANVALKAAAPPPSQNTVGPGTSQPNGGVSTTGGSQGTSPPAGGGVVTTILTTTGVDGNTITSTRTSTDLNTSNGVSSGTQLTPTSTKLGLTSSSSSTLTPGAGAANTQNSSQSKTLVAVIAGVTVGGVILLVLLLLLLLFCLKRRRGAVPPAASISDRDEILTAATIAPSAAALSPSSGASSPEPMQHIEPFVLQSRHDDGLRSKSHYEKSGQIWGNVRNTNHDRSPSTSSGATSGVQTQNGELGVTMSRLHELAEELNRGLAERGPNTPRLMLVSGRDAELIATNSTSGSVYHGHGRHDSAELPPYEGRRE